MNHMMLSAALSLVFLITIPVEEKFAPSVPLRARYLGQTPPGSTPQIFAPGLVNVGMHTRDIAITPDGKGIYFSVVLGENTRSTVLMSRYRSGRWTEPEVVPFARDPRFSTIEPCISADGRRFLFVSDRPTVSADAKGGKWDIWVVERKGDGWGEPTNLGAPVNTSAGEYFPSLTRDGSLYFTRETPDQSDAIFRSRWKEGRYLEPELLPSAVNSGRAQFNAFVSPDESYLIVPVFGRKDSLGSTDYYVVFRNPDDSWSQPVNLGDRINTPGGEEFSPYVTSDGKYFFFMSPRTRPELFTPDRPLTSKRLRELHNTAGNGHPAIWWVEASFIETLRPKPPDSGD